MFKISRINRSRLANWWWTVDKVTLSLILILIFIGAFLVFSASPSVARTNGYEDYHFIKRQIIWITISLGIIVFFSMQRLKTIRRMAIIGYFLAMILMLITIFAGYETKGASRWIRIFGISLQPSEFIKPTFIVLSAWLLDGSKKFEDFPGGVLSTFFYAITIGMLILQPDIGMTILVSAIWGFQLFLSGLPMLGISILGGIAILGGVCAYFTFSHVHERVEQFFTAGAELSYQVRRSVESFANGNLLGRGPGEGSVKLHLPDSHTDFILAVAGEEFGVWLCAIIVLIFATIVIRSLLLSLKDHNLFIVYAAAGLAASFGAQAIMNMASTLYLMPLTGMTLPFISYGGSSMFASSITIGMILALTRRNSTAEDKDGPF